MANITLRSDLLNPLSIAQVDTNFTNLNNDKLEVSQFNENAILTKLKLVDGVGSGLDADVLDGMQPASTNTASTVVARDSSGNFSAGTITAALNGNAGTVTNGVYTNAFYPNPSWITSLAGSKITALPNTSLTNSSITINGVSVALGGSISLTGTANTYTALQTFRDTLFRITDDSDTTKILNFELASITSGQTRVLTVPNANGTIATQEYVQTAGRNSQGNKTISTSAPSGGSSGDIWYRV